MNAQATVAESGVRRKWGVLAIISLPLFIVMLDVTVVNIALPHIMSSYNIGLGSIEWVFNVYVLVFAALLLPLGKLGDMFGRRRLFLTGLGVFTIGSLGCALAPAFNVLLIFRGVQAIGGAAMLPATLSILNVEFDKNQRGLALGLWGAVSGAANAIGPVIGGSLVDAASWRFIFVINIPVGIIAFFLTLLIVAESRDRHADRHIDIPGLVTVALGLVCLTYALVEGQKSGWTSPSIVTLFALAGSSLIAFVLIELRTSRPLANLNLFGNRVFASGSFVLLAITFSMIGVLYLTVLFLQIILGFSALKAGLTLLPLPLAIILAAPLAGRMTDRIGGRWILVGGTLLAASGIYLMSGLSAATDWTDLVLPLGLCGLGMGSVMAPVATVIMANTPVDQSGMGAGILSTVRNIASVLGLSVLGAVLQNQMVNNITRALAEFPQVPAFLRDQVTSAIHSGSLGAGGVSLPPQLSSAVGVQVTTMLRDQFAISLNTTMRISVLVVLLATLVSLLISKGAREAK